MRTTRKRSWVRSGLAALLASATLGGRPAAGADPSVVSPIVSLVLEPICGDGALEDGERCDDGNALAGDCCDTACRPEPAGSLCGGGCNPRHCDGGGHCVL